jgi:hypothetical protein
MMNTKTSTIETSDKKRGRKPNNPTHGLTGVAALLPGEDESLFASMREGLRESLKPVGAIEEELVERAAGLTWRMRRIGRLENEILTELSKGSEVRQMEERVEWLSKMLSTDMVSLHQLGLNRDAYLERAGLLEKVRELLNREGTSSFGQGLLMAETDRSFGLLRRYESRMERSLYLALGQLAELQSVRKAEERAANRVIGLSKVTLVSNGQLRECEWQPGSGDSQ